ncbi:MAG: hypothetical protein ACRELC_13270, partial [Gemmatimonadota bacterium]
VGAGETLAVAASLSGSELEVRIRHAGSTAAIVVDPQVTAVEGATFVSLETPAPEVVVLLDVGSPPSPTGRFTLNAQLQGIQRTCPVTRTFDFTISGGDVVVT